jgi:replicative DNA helicase
MKRIFRSIINIKDTIPQTDLVKNYRSFLASFINPEEASYIKLYGWLDSHFKSFGEMPSLEFIFEKATTEGEGAILVNLKEMAEQRPYIGSNYRAILKEKYEEQNEGEFQKILTTSWDIVKSGKPIGKGKDKKELKGVGDAIEFINSETRKFRMRSIGVKTEGNIRQKEDTDEVMEEYEEVKNDPIGHMGIFTNLIHMDNICHGWKLGELFLPAAFVGHGKSTFSVNIAHSAILQGKNGLYVPLEMSYSEMRAMVAILHTSNPDWYDYPKYKPLVGKMSHTKFQDGAFSDMEEEFFKAALKDFYSNPNYGELYIWQPETDLTPTSLELKMYDVHAGLLEKGKSLDFIIVDYVGLMHPDKNERSSNYNDNLNTILRKLKNIAMRFDNGRKTRIMTPFQFNREGWKEAEKNDGNYRLSALSNANEAERSADLVISIYMSDEMKKKGLMKICCLKNRRRALFNPFEARVNLESKLIDDIVKTNEQDENSHLMEIPVDIPT